jgi:hypothetical protein
MLAPPRRLPPSLAPTSLARIEAAAKLEAAAEIAAESAALPAAVATVGSSALRRRPGAAYDARLADSLTSWEREMQQTMQQTSRNQELTR